METVPPPLAKPPASTWPKTIGVIAIIFGVGGIFQGILSPLSLFLTRQQMQAFVDQGADQASVDEYLARLTTNAYLSLAVYLVLAVLLLTGGILLLKRRKVASPLLQTWGVLKILAGGFILFRMTSLTQLQMAIIMESTLATASKGGAGASGGADMAMVNQFTTYAVWAGLGFGFLWLAILPVFLIIWFNRRKVMDQMKTW
jgi:hypothetical protein